MKVLVPALLALAAAWAASQERPAAPPLAEAKSSLVPGLSLRLDQGPHTDFRDTRLAALTVPAGTAPSPFLAPGPFKALWEGFVSVDLGTDVQFSASGRGSLRVVVNGKPALEAKGEDLSAAEGPSLRLKKGRNALQVFYEAPAEGEASVRLLWTSSDFPKEPVPPLSLSHDTNTPELRGARRIREGRELVAQRRCLKCHSDPVKGFPELEMDAPSLADAGARLHADWMEAWILDPRSIRPEATMPKIAGLSGQDAADLAVYLSTLGAPAEGGAAAPAAAGGVLFAEMRCVGCHTLPEQAPAADRIPLRHVKAKWRPAALRAFLKAPQSHYAWIEMPDFRLSDEEASLLAAFLLSREGQPVKSSGLKGDAARGRALAGARGCMNCHTIPATNTFKAAPLRAIPAAKWASGCLAADGRGAAPDFGFGAPQRDAIAAFASGDLAALGRDAAPEFLERQIRALRCFACHKRDDRADAWSDVAGETKDLVPKKKEDDGEFVEIAPAEPWFPSLTWTGEKLRPEWAAAFLRGDPAIERPRPYLKTLRMPSFPARAAGLALGMAFEHGAPAASPPLAAPDAELAEHGRRLSGPMGGLDCLSCHAIGPKGATKVFEAPAPNFRLAKDRLRRDYFERWLREPLRLEPGTKMPQFIKEGRTQLTDVLDGDAVKQTEALWQYLLEGAAIRPPGE